MSRLEICVSGSFWIWLTNSTGFVLLNMYRFHVFLLIWTFHFQVFCICIKDWSFLSDMMSVCWVFMMIPDWVIDFAEDLLGESCIQLLIVLCLRSCVKEEKRDLESCLEKYYLHTILTFLYSFCSYLISRQLLYIVR